MVDITRTRLRNGYWYVTWRFDDDAFEKLKAVAEERHFGTGTFVYHEGDKQGTTMYVVRKGEAHVLRNAKDGGAPSTIASVRLDESFGELGLLADRPRTASVVAATDLIVLEISRTSLEMLQRRDPIMVLMLYRALARTLAEQVSVIRETQEIPL